ncbi:MAG TPA: hypothetical protein VNY73_04130 [Bacteroidia bacterium]|jgi:hypothetical protein|nr:hypothetical protein [Bacteroidia bacterium]
MEQNYLQRNLLSLTAEFYHSGKTKRGAQNITAHINSNRISELEYLLRYHDPIPVYGAELIHRFEIDSLIEFYNILLIAALAGYISPDFDPRLNEEIKKILGHPSVRPYYEKHYPYVMPSLTLNYVNSGNRAINQEMNTTTIGAFNDFIILNRMLKRDKDLERFMGMLDYVSYGNDDLDDVIEVLASEKKLSKILSDKRKDDGLNQAIWGFIKYTGFLSQMRQLLEDTKEYNLLQSSIWLFHGYYFDRMNEEMKIFFDKAFDSLEIALTQFGAINNLASEIFKEEIPPDFNEKEMKSFAHIIIKKTKDDVAFVLDKRFGIALNDFLKNEFA